MLALLGPQSSSGSITEVAAGPCLHAQDQFIYQNETLLILFKSRTTSFCPYQHILYFRARTTFKKHGQLQVSEASASGADLDTLSEELFRQLSSGQTVNLGSVFRPAKQDAGHPTEPVTLNPQATPAQQHQHLHRAAQAISAAAAAAAVNQGTTPGALLGTAERSGSGQLEGAPAASVSGLLRVASEAPGPAR